MRFEFYMDSASPHGHVRYRLTHSYVKPFEECLVFLTAWVWE